MQDKENGGISDRPDDAVDVFHTYFGVAGKGHMTFLYCETANVYFSSDDMMVHMTVEKDLGVGCCIPNCVLNKLFHMTILQKQVSMFIILQNHGFWKNNRSWPF